MVVYISGATEKVLAFLAPYLSGMQEGPVPNFKRIAEICGCRDHLHVHSIVNRHLFKEDKEQLKMIGVERAPQTRSGEKMRNADRLFGFIKEIIDQEEQPFPLYKEISQRFRDLGGKANVYNVADAVDRLDETYQKKFKYLHGVRIQDGSELGEAIAAFIRETAEKSEKTGDLFPEWDNLAEGFKAWYEVQTGIRLSITGSQVENVFDRGCFFRSEERKQILALKRGKTVTAGH